MYLEDVKNDGYRKLLERFLSYLKDEQRFKESTLTNYRRVLAKVDIYMEKNGIPAYSEQVGIDYYEHCITEERNHPDKNVSAPVAHLNDFFAGRPFRTQKEVHTDPVISDALISVVDRYIKSCSGNRLSTVKEKESVIKRFLYRCTLDGCTEISDLNCTIIERACLGVTDRNDWAIIRAFLLFIFNDGIVAKDFSTLVPHFKRSFHLPTVYSVEEIQKIENAVDRTTSKGKRDYAMILCVTRLGMRSGDIVALGPESVDFQSETISIIQEKTGTPLSLPLLPDVKYALEDYISNGRPVSDEQRFFLRANAPFKAITTSALRFALRGYFIKADIDFKGKKHGPHSLRSSISTSMVNDGVSYEVVRAVLGHSDPNAIKHYAKLDIEKLRMCALDVPEPSDVFASFLKGGHQCLTAI